MKRLLHDVMEAIASLKEGKGSTVKKIHEQLGTILTLKKRKRSNMQEIKKILKQGVEAGLIQRQGVKYKLGLASTDYEIFKDFQKRMKLAKGGNGELKIRQNRRRRRSRRRRRGRSRRRRRASVRGQRGSSITSATSKSELQSNEKKKLRSRSKGEKSTDETDYSYSPLHSNFENIASKSSRTKTGSVDSRRSSKQLDEDSHDMLENDAEHNDFNQPPNCGNPECLCNMTQNINEVNQSDRDEICETEDRHV